MHPEGPAGELDLFGFLRSTDLSWKAKAQVYNILTDGGSRRPTWVETDGRGLVSFRYGDSEQRTLDLTGPDPVVVGSRSDTLFGGGSVSGIDKLGGARGGVYGGGSTSGPSAGVGAGGKAGVLDHEGHRWVVDGQTGEAWHGTAGVEALSASGGLQGGMSGSGLSGTGMVSGNLIKGEVGGSYLPEPSASYSDVLDGGTPDQIHGSELGLGLDVGMGGGLDIGKRKGDLTVGIGVGGNVDVSNLDMARHDGIFDDGDLAEMTRQAEEKAYQWMNGPGGGREGIERYFDRQLGSIDPNAPLDVQEAQRARILEQKEAWLSRYDELSASQEPPGGFEPALEGIRTGLGRLRQNLSG